MAPCRFGEVCARIGSGKGRSARWVAVWALLAGQEEELMEVVKDISKECFSEHIMEQTVKIAVPRERAQQWEEAEVSEIIIVSDGVEGTFVDWVGAGVDLLAPQIAAKIREVVETILQEHIFVDLPVPQVVKENLEVIKRSRMSARLCLKWQKRQ